jgi:hypothetical protein
VTRVLLAALLVLVGCAGDVESIETDETDAQLYSDAFDRWLYFGFGISDQSTCYDGVGPSGWPKLRIPREVFADGGEFTRLCNGADPSEAAACQAYVPGTHNPLIVLQPNVRNLRKVRAHEYYHWIAECSGVATDWANEHHAVPGVWAPVDVGDDFLMSVFQ